VGLGQRRRETNEARTRGVAAKEAKIEHYEALEVHSKFKDTLKRHSNVKMLLRLVILVSSVAALNALTSNGCLSTGQYPRHNCRKYSLAASVKQ
jgi:hypothetical protein